MFRAFMGIDNLEAEINVLREVITSKNKRIEDLQFIAKQRELDFQFEKQVQQMNIEAARNEIRKEMQKSLVQADVERARLEGELKASPNTLADKNNLIYQYYQLVNELRAANYTLTEKIVMLELQNEARKKKRK